MARTVQLRQRVQGAFAGRLVHTYTRTSVATGTEDSQGNDTNTPGVPVPDQPCLYDPAATPRLRIGTGGLVEVDVPTLYVLPDDPLKSDDIVTNITDSGCATIVPGPLTVDTVTMLSGVGPEVLKQASLREGLVR